MLFRIEMCLPSIDSYRLRVHLRELFALRFALLARSIALHRRLWATVVQCSDESIDALGGHRFF